MSTDCIVGGRYLMTKRLSTKGMVFAGNNIKTNEEVAIKLEKNKVGEVKLAFEAQIYQKMKGKVGFP
jgi:hypothetical protein